MNPPPNTPKSPTKSGPPGRRRRSAEEARRLILDAAEKRLRQAGPGALRLQEVAADVGVSHPTILHHFGSRDELRDEVVRRALDKLQTEIVEIISSAEATESTAVEVLNRTLSHLRDAGHGRMLAWLALSGQDLSNLEHRLHELAQLIHGPRVEAHGKPIAFEDTLFWVLLTSLAMFGEAVVGEPMFASAGLAQDADSRQRFNGWFAKVLAERLGGEPGQ